MPLTTKTLNPRALPRPAYYYMKKKSVVNY